MIFFDISYYVVPRENAAKIRENWQKMCRNLVNRKFIDINLQVRKKNFRMRIENDVEN